MSDVLPDPPHRLRERPAHASGRRAFWSAFGLLWLLTATWSLASPLASGPDENAHVVKAAAVVRGQLDGRSAPDNPGSGVVDVPAVYADLMTYPICFAFHGDQSARCTTPLPTGAAAERETPASTWVVRNNPLYYAIVGLPTLLPPSSAVVYLMRLLSAALTSAVLAWGFRELMGLARRSFVVVGVVAALTPMVVFLDSVVNPSGLETAAALTLWIAFTAMVREPDPSRVVSRSAGIAVVSVLLVNTRGLSPLYLAAIAVSVALVGPWAGARAVLQDRRTWPWMALVVAGTAVSLVWTLGAGTLAGGGAGHPELGFFSTANRTLTDTGEFLVMSIGRFGWLDTSLPTLVLLVAAALIGLPTLVALALGSRRDRLGVALVVGVAVFMPVLIQAWQARNVGYIWTARYSLPLSVGVVVVAGFAVRAATSALPVWVGRRFSSTLLPAFAAVQLVAFLANLRRYTVGDNGSWRRVFDGPWSPPVSALVLTLVEAAGLALGVWLLTRADGARRTELTTARGDGATAAELPAAVAGRGRDAR